MSLLLVFLSGCEEEKKGATLAQGSKEQSLPTHKNVIVLMIDSLTEDIINRGLERGSNPALSYLMKKGSAYHDVIAPFPSMSVVIESTLLTGESPSAHRVPGLIWYDQERNDLIDYGSTIPRTWKLGTKRVLMNGLVHLNNHDLAAQTETIHEALHKRKLTSGSINMLVYRGPKSHQIHMPSYMRYGLHLPKTLQTKGPDLLALWKAVQPKVIQDANLSDGPFHSFGVNDQFSTAAAEVLIKEKEQPDFLMVLLPNFDKDAHTFGDKSGNYFSKVDLEVQKILNAYSSWDEALEKNIFVIMGDHGQSQIKPSKEEALINLPALLHPYTVAPLLDDPSSGNIVIANNHRMAYLYTVDGTPFLTLYEKLQHDKRIDHLAWMEGNNLVIYGSDEEDSLRVKKGGKWIDSFNQTWTLNGNIEIGDISLDEESGSLTYGDYPDLFTQLIEALTSHHEPMVVTAKPGYILHSEDAPVHINGGEHGGLHKEDTVTSMIIAGTKKQPTQRRMKDLKDYFLSLYEER